MKMIFSLLSACSTPNELKFLTRCVAGNLRAGIGEKSILTALVHSTLLAKQSNSLIHLFREIFAKLRLGNF
jgi:hypothetical protein